MSAIATAMLQQFTLISESIELPAVQAFHLPPAACEAARKATRQNNFGYLQLEDGSIGLTYVALGDTLNELRRNTSRIDITGLSPLELIALYQEHSEWQRALGLSAINAVSQYVLSRVPSLRLPPPDATQPAAETQPERVGMVGYFRRLVEPLRQQGIPLTVIELDRSLLRQEPGLEVTLDASQLKSCTRVIITGTTLINQSLDGLLAHCRGARDIQLLGPSASCLPDVLFDAGVTEVGGFRVLWPDRFANQWRNGQRWRESGERYCLSARQYPGLAACLNAIEDC